jgi:hypothetical protein
MFETKQTKLKDNGLMMTYLDESNLSEGVTAQWKLLQEK